MTDMGVVGWMRRWLSDFEAGESDPTIDVVRSALALIEAQEKEIAALRSERFRLLGYISGTPGWSDKHPEEVVKWWEANDPK